MKIVILGAGASYDCINRFHDKDHDAHKWRPPLGNDIFGARVNFREIYDKYPGALSLSHSINAGNDIEDFFQNKWELAVDKNDKHTLANIINTQYCLQELFYKISIEYSKNIGSSNYHVLIQQAHDYHIRTGEDVVFITFNYDLLLEYALLQYYNEEQEITFKTYTKYPIKIFKPHGSCNWFKKFKRDKFNFEFLNMIKLKPSLQDVLSELDEEFKVSDFPIKNIHSERINFPIFHLGQDRSNRNNYRHCFPQLLIPIKTKDDFVMSKEHLDEMNKYLSKCNDMLIIGWKGQEEFFLQTLKEQCGENEISATFVTCRDNLPFDEIKKQIPSVKPIFFGIDYFESHLEGDKNVFDLEHNEGTFSSYILNVTKNGYKGFFDIDAK